MSLAAVFRLESTRTVSNDWVVRYANRHFQLERQSHQPPARSTVQVLEDAAGQIDIRYRDRRIRWTEITPPLGTTSTTRARTPGGRPPIPTPARPRHTGVADHPWHQGVKNPVYQQMVRERRAWARVQP
jgi:hypothetical protein